MNGITYFRLKSQYDGDFTKNCALDGYEVDTNFNVLEGRDIKGVALVGDDIVISLLNGETIKAEGVVQHDGISDISFDKTKGILKVTRNGKVEEFNGFSTNYNTGLSVATDGTLVGTGQSQSPISIAKVQRTGQYRPVDIFVDLSNQSCSCCDSETVPDATVGQRVLVKEKIGDFGLLYDYKAVRSIAYDLNLEHSSWRIPSKEDWDDMLDAVEPCDCDRTHTQANANKYLGRWAGKMLKSTSGWQAVTPCCDGDDCCESDTCIKYDDVLCPVCDDASKDSCNTTPFCGEHMHDKHGKHVKDDHAGIDKFGFRITPAGYADDGSNFGFFGSRAGYWTSTNSKGANAYIKRFEYNKCSVYQDIIASTNFMSLRLIKDYDGGNYNVKEDILGESYPTVLMPSKKNGKAIWTSVNIAIKKPLYNVLEPNNGQNITSTIHYYINEFDGKKWSRSELLEGESVVIKEAPNGKTDVEYRIINGELVNVTDTVYDNVMEIVQPSLDKISEDLKSETERAIAADESLENRATDLEERATKLEEDMQVAKADIQNVDGRVNYTDAKVKEINDTLAAFGTETNKAIELLNTNLVQAINTINGAIATEVSDRAAADDLLSSDIATTNEKLDTVNKEINAKIDKEVAEINTALDTLDETDTKLQSEIDKLDEDLAKANENIEKNADAIELNAEAISDLQDADVEIKGDILTSEGTSFDKNSGILTLKSSDGSNDIQVQFSFNFGTF
jgi:hypothetical protein